MAQDSTKDFFISYNRADRAWTEWIVWQLDAEGYTTILYAWDLRPGSNVVLKLHEVKQAAEHMIAALSLSYLDALSSQPEWATAFMQNLISEQDNTPCCLYELRNVGRQDSSPLSSPSLDHCWDTVHKKPRQRTFQQQECVFR